MIKYYNEYDGQRYVRAYDTNNGVREMGTIMNPCTLIYHGTTFVNELFETIDGALRGWGEWSDTPVVLPDGTMATPVERLHPDCNADPFIRWCPGIRELWPGEY